ncbi:S8 family serine peptidase [Dokdonella soli]|uniref:S8 family serine peptidase n=1 Tax=Dokdonella soli TaxID=529810 RepID=A0ABN1ISC6_9GAMM
MPPKAGATAVDSAGVHQGHPGGLNQQVKPSSRSKFIAEPDRNGTDVYIVRLHDLSVATYDGRVRGYAATKDALQHHSMSARSPISNAAPVAAYRQYLQSRHEAVLAAAHSKGIDAPVRRHFTDSINGFTVALTQQQASTLAQLPQVAYVQRSDLRPMLTDRGPEFIGAKTVWTGGSNSGLPYQGEGIVVGMLDSGANTDHPSFAAVGGDGYVHTNPLGSGHYLGDCAKGTAVCNDKLIGVWSWPVITNSYQGVRPPSGEDYNGHGSHTASTAAGNVVNNVPLVGSSLGDGAGTPTGFSFAKVSGVAPHANIIAYQVCFPTGGCPDEAVITAVDQAIQDGVDVINFSIGGNERFPWDDALALSFLSARAAGIAIAAAAGNNGPNFFTLSHSAPWYLAVAASTHDRVLNIPQKQLTLTGGATAPPAFATDPSTTYGGISASGVTGILVNATGDGLCANPFAAGTFTSNQIVVCKRGAVAHLAKAANVRAGGAGGFVLVNAGYPNDLDDLSNDVYPLPGVQLHSWDGQALQAWMADGVSAHNATISATTITRSLDPATGDQLADFSSRGPSSTFEGSLSPGISAPGVDIFAAFADEHPFDPGSALSRDWALESGTSMASPHVAGAMALVRQAHPDWTAAEVQSALQMTASQTVTYGATPYTPAKPAGTYRAGSGRVDVLAAVNAGLVMDESAANFTWANPHNGGDVLQLNLPQLVDSHCRDVCSWIRTVTATRDGTWTVSAGPWTFDRWSTGEGEISQNGIRFDAYPATFTLRAGESKSILLRADLTDAQFRYDGTTHTSASEQIELWSKVLFTPSNSAIPAAHWPISVNFDHGVLPKTLELNAHRDQGSYRLHNVNLPAMASTSYRTYGLTRPSVQDISLNQDIDHIPPQDDGDYSHNNTRTYLVDVPAGSARLVVENLKNVATTADARWKAGWLTIYVGIDSNGTGVPDFTNETLCVSNTEVELNYCSISHPDAGRYWVFINNVRGGLADGDPTIILDTYRLATAVVPETPGVGVQVSGPASTTGAPVDLDLNWNLPPMATDDVAYAAFDVGLGNAPGSVGFVPVKITRGGDDVGMTVSQTRARPGDVIDVHMHVRENDSGMDRFFNLQSILPSGLTLVPGSATVNTSAQRANLSVAGNSLQIAGTQKDSENWPRDYVVTTSRNDPLCRTPIFSANGQSSSGGFVGLVKTLGLQPNFGGHADLYATASATIPLANYWDGGYSLYNNSEFFSYPDLQISPQGWVIMEPNFGYTMFLHQKFPYLTLPYTPMIGVLWKGTPQGLGFNGPSAVDALATPLNISMDPSQTTGMAVAYGTNSHDLIFEWVGARSEHIDLNTGVTTTLDDKYDFELLLNRDYRFGDGEFEMIMAYDNLNFGSQASQGSIGVQGYHGPLTSFGPLNGDLAVNYAYNDLQSKLSNGLLVCYDYRGPESTQFDLNFKVRVSELAAGTNQLLHWASHIDGMTDRNVDAVIQVVGNLTLAGIADQITAPNTTLHDIPVLYHDNGTGPDTVSVSGAHVTAVVHGNAPGDTFDLIPDPNFVGSTVVTVTVSDQNNPSDHASTSFSLLIGSDTIFANGFE